METATAIRNPVVDRALPDLTDRGREVLVALHEIFDDVVRSQGDQATILIDRFGISESDDVEAFDE